MALNFYALEMTCYIYNQMLKLFDLKKRKH